MLILPKTIINFNFKHWDKIDFRDHFDYDLKGHCQGIAIKSLDGKIHTFYRDGLQEHPDDYSYTAYYKLFKPLVDFFDINTTRIRLHQQLPNNETPMHVDYNNIEVKNNADYNIRLLTALSESDDFIYRFKPKGEELKEFTLKKGQSVIFDPDIVAHGMINNSKTETRYSLIQIFKAYPVTPWLKDFINTEQIIKL